MSDEEREQSRLVGRSAAANTARQIGGLFSRRPRKRRLHQPETVVLCVFRDMTRPSPLWNFDPERAYAYRWVLPTRPSVGQWAIVTGHDGGPATVIVGAIGVNSYVREVGTDSLATITRLVPIADVAAAQAALAQKLEDERAADTSWLAHCRLVAGVETSRPTPPAPAGLDVPPLPGEVDGAESADRHGRSWWRAYKRAEELQHPAEESDRFGELARAWFRIRDAIIKEEQLSSVKSIARSVDLDRAIRDVVSGKDCGDRPGHFLGEPIWDWLRYVEYLSRAVDGEDGQALALAYALITLAEKEATASGREPAPAYTMRAAILHRKRKEYSQEVAVLERWESTCPPEMRGPGALQPQLASRLARARELAAKQARSA